jgi:hypothetical protein
MRLTPAPHWSPANWIVAGLGGFAESVLSLVPAGFESYVRIFHPAVRAIGHELEQVRWAEIAAANGRQAHAGMQLTALTGSFDAYRNGQAGLFDGSPEIGSLPAGLVEPLTTVLARHTGTPDRCWFAFWDGFGGLRDEIALGPTFTVPCRAYHLLSGPLDGVSESATDGAFQSANLWWPADQAWCVATEIDLDTTYIGCGRTCANELLRVPELEALPIDPSTGIDYASDALNPGPAPE